MTEEHHGPLRLLPWSGSDGKPCYLVGEGGGYVSRVADEIEGVQLGMADDILGHAEDMLGGRQVTSRELRFLARGWPMRCGMCDGSRRAGGLGWPRPGACARREP
ncbi:hypothetical protein ACFVJH_35885 [Streptomyces decoyicus]|uniref:hypothetical protein n=1 Tax=Streptomyces decoyicus TaxID=249567 RepID=UPI003630DED8